MSLDYGTGVSRTLSPADRSWASVIWQSGKPPLDSELNLMSAVELERQRQYIAGVMPSGFLMDPTRAEHDFQFSPLWVNHFQFGIPRTAMYSLDSDETQPVLWANVNGWIIPVAGTDISGVADVHNVVNLYPGPGSDNRIDFVFLEAWATLVQPNPSTLNKPTASTVWKFGNVMHGGTNITDDLEDPTVGFETSKRVQVQYRLRVYGSGGGGGASVNLAVHPDGLEDPNILGQGAATAGPVAAMVWSNMREALGDPSLWRAGDGNPNNGLGTIDGYSYAIPVAAIFRRNSQIYLAATLVGAGDPNQNGASLRTPGVSLLADPLAGDVVLLQASLGALLGPDDGKLAPYDILITNLNGSGLEDTALVLSSIYLQIEDEIVGISAVNLGAGTVTIPTGGRGRWGTAAVGHDTGTLVSQWNSRPDGLYVDEIASQDVLDLRRAVNPGDWDYTRLLSHNVAALAKGTLRTTWKECNPGDTEGPVVHEVAELYAADATHPNDTDAVDGPDGIRTIWSDGASIQPDVTLMLEHDATRDASGMIGFTNAGFDANVEWDVGASFNPIGFQNTGGNADGWYNGSSVHLFIGGTTGELGARATFRAAGVRDVRFVTPGEYWKTGYPIVDPTTGNQHPVSLRFLGEKITAAPPSAMIAAEAAEYPGPMYPAQQVRFERPFIVLGGLLEPTLREVAVNVSNLSSAADIHGTTRYYLDLTAAGYDFDAAGTWNDADEGVFSNDVSQVSMQLLREERTLYGMLTDEGRDRTGASSEVYLMTFGDPTGRNNNGAFRVIGAGTVAVGAGTVKGQYTSHFGTAVGMLVLEPLSGDFSTWSAPSSGNTITVDFRSQYHNADDTSSYVGRIADYAIVLTDIAGELDEGLPWDTANYVLGAATLPLAQSGGFYYAPSKMVLSTTLMYHPGRSAPTRVPDDFVRFAMRGGVTLTLGSYLRRAAGTIDTTFVAAGTADDEVYWPMTHVSTWNRLSGLGWHAPLAPSYGGEVIGFTEQDRESECFVDRGSKTLLFRPFRNRDMTLQALTWGAGEWDTVNDCLMGLYKYPVTLWDKDQLDILTGTSGTDGKRMGFFVPREFMPRFGRQDIPYYQLNAGSAPGAANFMPGINHLFTDVTDNSNPVFNIIGGEKNAGGSEVNSLFFVTRASEIAYTNANATYGAKNIAAMGARNTSDIVAAASTEAAAIVADLAAVNSSDFGRGLEGIQMPPFVGIARLYGVYEYEDYVTKGGVAHKANRYEMDAASVVNLLREDADQQTLFILQDGGQDQTFTDDVHTYIIPSNVLDLSRIPAAPAGTPVHTGYVEGVSVFSDFDYVVEATVFFFAKGFINKTNVVLVRRYDGSFNLNIDTSDPELENVPMCIPSPAHLNSRHYTSYNRTVYQGDPFMSRDGATRTVSDYSNRYGRLTPSQAHLLRTAVQQYDPDGSFNPEMINGRAFEVLASMDFYTTLGTGKVGGAMFAGTPLDVGYIGGSDLVASRMPLLTTSNDWRVGVRAFTEGQKDNTSHAQATVEILNNENLLIANTYEDTFYVRFTLLDDTVVTLYGADAYFRAVLAFAPYNVPLQDMFVVDRATETSNFVYSRAINFGTLGPTPGKLTSVVTFTPNVAVHPGPFFPTGVGSPPKSVTVTLDEATTFVTNDYGSVVFDARALDTGDIEVRASFVAGPIPFHVPDATDDPGDLRNVRSFVIDFSGGGGGVAAHASATDTVAWTGAAVGDAVLVRPGIAQAWDNGLIVSGYVSAVDVVTVVAHNATTGALVPNAAQDFDIALLQDVDLTSANIALLNADLLFDVMWETGSKDVTANSLVDAINAHSDLGRSVTAFNDGTPKVTVESVPVGTEGNGIRVDVGRHSWDTAVGTSPLPLLEATLKLAVPAAGSLPVGHNTTGTNLFGGVDLPVNAGNGTSQMALTGMTERLPLGVLVQDSDFLGENPLGDDASAMNSSPAPLRPIQTLLPLTDGGEEYSRFMGAPGELVAMSDGVVAPQSIAAWQNPPGAGTKFFRLYRGGGSAYVWTGDNPGGPIDWVSDSFPKAATPVLKSGVLACRAVLVRNFYEEAFGGGSLAKTSDGDEIQMVVLTYAHLGDGNSTTEGVTLDGIISPSGYGEGYAAADRYRCMGHPMVRGYSRAIPDPRTATLAAYPEDQRGT